MAIEGGVGDFIVEMGRLHAADIGTWGNAGHVVDQIGPGFSPITRKLKVSVIGARPEDAFFGGRLGDGGDGAIRLGIPGIGRIGRVPDQRGDFADVVGGQVGTDGGPAVAAIVETEQPVSAEIQRFGIVRRKKNRSVPVVAKILRAFFGHWPDILIFAPFEVYTPQISVVPIRVNRIWIGGIHLHLHAVAVKNLIGVGAHDSADIVRAAGKSPHTVILQSTIYMIRSLHIHGDSIELAGRIGVKPGPVCSAVVSCVGAAVRAENGMRRIRRIDPQRMMIGMDVAQ